MNDIEVIACYAPYCDTMFIDNECQRLLKNGLKKSKIKLMTQIFSQQNQNEFLKHLDQIENSVSKNHLVKVIEVYGKSWLKPYIEMYQ
jgi:hypothetical protein